MQEMVEITKEKYEELLDNDAFLACLFAAGVDSWDGFSSAQEMMAEEE